MERRRGDAAVATRTFRGDRRAPQVPSRRRTGPRALLLSPRPLVRGGRGRREPRENQSASRRRRGYKTVRASRRRSKGAPPRPRDGIARPRTAATRARRSTSRVLIQRAPASTRTPPRRSGGIESPRSRATRKRNTASASRVLRAWARRATPRRRNDGCGSPRVKGMCRATNRSRRCATAREALVKTGCCPLVLFPGTIQVPAAAAPRPARGLSRSQPRRRHDPFTNYAAAAAAAPPRTMQAATTSPRTMQAATASAPRPVRGLSRSQPRRPVHGLSGPRLRRSPSTDNRSPRLVKADHP